MNRTSLAFRVLLPVILLAGAFAVCAATSDDAGDKLDKRLVPIAAAAQQHLEAPFRDAAVESEARHTLSPFEPHWNAAGQVQVYLHYDKANAAPDREQLQALGAKDIVNSPELGVIQAWVPASQLYAVSALPGVLRVGLPRYAVHKLAPVQHPMTYTGTVDTQGDGILQAVTFRQKTGDTGQGVTVGVISDGDQHASDSQKSHDLPTKIWNDPNDAGSFKSSGDEGTAMMEIVYDLAPGVDQLGFCGPATTVDFITCLNDFNSNIGADVVVDDLGFPGGAMFSQDTFTSGVANFAQAHPNVHLVTAAGNDGTGFWEGTWNPTSVSTTVNGISYTQAMDFGSGNTDIKIIVPNTGDTLGYIVEWDDPWSDTTKTPDPNDFDVVVFTGPNGTGTAVACNQGLNIGPTSLSGTCNQTNSQSTTTPGPQPIQGSQWKANNSTYYLEIFGVHGTLTNKRFKVLVFDQSAFQVVLFPSTSGSVEGQSALPFPSEITVGAVNPNDLLLESFSSTGPVKMGTGGAHTSFLKPDFVAPDCVKVTGAGGFPSTFCGTSAAAPHIAGLVALMVSGYSNSPYTLLKDSATPKGSPVPNGDYGYGLPNMATLLKKGLKPNAQKSSGGGSSGGGGDTDVLTLSLLGLAAGLRRRRPPGDIRA